MWPDGLRRVLSYCPVVLILPAGNRPATATAAWEYAHVPPPQPELEGRIPDLVRLLPQAGRGVVSGLVGVAAAQAAAPLVIIALTGALVDRAAASPTFGEVAGPLVVLAAVFGLQQVLGLLHQVLGYTATSRIDGQARAAAMEAATAPPGVALVEDQSVQDLMEVASGKPLPFRSATPGGGAVGVISLAGRVVQGVGAAVLVARFSLLLAAGLLVTTLAIRRRMHGANRTQALAFQEHVPTYRRCGYLSGLATVPGPAKELRVFGLAGWVLARHRGAWTQVTSSMSAARHHSSRRVAGCYLLALPVHATVFVVTGLAAADGRIGLGTLTVVIQGARQVVDLGTIGSDDYQIDFGSASIPAAAELQQRSRAAAAATPSGSRSADALPRVAIAFDGVTFAYPGSREAVLEGLDLTVPAGTSLAVVGANGAGKTTLVKLLARLYEPSEGRILVDGVDVRELDLWSWRTRLAVIFQDFVRYELSAADNVGLGGLPRLGDAATLSAAARRAGTLELIEALPRGWDTVLARGYRGGAELSGGEWQRVALARALLAVEAGASVLALDEPTANLDVRAEAELFDHLLDLTSTGDDGPSRLTTLLISHRFSTVRRAERICVLDHGRVAEIGTHHQLLAAGNRYARMFSLQAARFDA